MIKREISKEWQDAGLDHISASQLLRTPAKWIFDYLHLTKDERQSVGVGEAAALGSVVHNAIQAIICHGQDIDQAIRSAEIAFDFHDADEDDVKRDRYRLAISAMVRNGVDILAENGFVGAVDEERIEAWLDDVNVPVLGFVDLLIPDTVFCEMKTKAPRKTKLLKDGTQGWAKATLPKKPEFNHVCQASIYWQATKVTPAICYIAEHDAVLFTAYNCEELQADGIQYALGEMRQKAIIRQNLLKVSNDAKVLASITDPDWSHMYQWNMKPEWLTKAKNLWKV